jgi:hypothetical protein
MKRILSIMILPTVASLYLSCAGRQGHHVPSEEPKAIVSQKIQAEAYLFDAVVRRQGKTTSFRLEMYATDSAIGLAGRGYLGKGALRGVVRRDSLQVYFPATNEYVDNSYPSLLSTGDCTLSLGRFDPVRFMFALPDSVAMDSVVRMDVEVKESNRRVYTVHADACAWKLTLSYDQRPTGWRPVELRYDDGHGTTLVATRREYQPRTRVPASRFSFSFPADAARIER